MTAARRLEWSDGAAGPLLRAADTADLREPVWQDFALCAQVDPELFFPEQGEPNWRAMKVCQGCEVSEECLEFALSQDEEPEGIWGGLTERSRRVIRREREAPLPPAVTASEKYCPRCGATKPAGEFWKNRSKAGGLGSYCITCELIRLGRVAA